jgi:hypothetical protein
MERGIEHDRDIASHGSILDLEVRNLPISGKFCGMRVAGPWLALLGELGASFNWNLALEN